MKIKTMSPQLLDAAVVLLQTAIPDLTTQNLIKAIRKCTPRMTSGKEMLTRAEAADRLGISLVTLHRWINEGLLNAVSITPRTVRIPSEEVENLLSGKEVK